ncbi:MAG: SpoIIE family protein phosphatase [Planctomycetota bacterium]
MSRRIEASGALVEAMNDAVRFRTAAVLLILMGTMVVNVVRLATSGDQGFSDEPIGVPLVMGMLVVYEGLTLLWLWRFRDRSRPLSGGWMYANAAIECSAPTALGFAIVAGGLVTLEQAALGPASHMYGLFIVLSILHVRLPVGVFAGAVSAVGLGVLVITADDGFGASAGGDGFLPQSVEVFSAVLVLATGGAAGLVALRMRRYLLTAVAEAEARQEAERDLQAAALIQQSLMPSEAPSVEGFEIVGWNRPADQTGGDYYDWVPLEDGRFAVCIADVTGHGLGPAMITCFCRAYARSALRVERRIAAALNRLNGELNQDLSAGRFVTFATVVLTPGNDRVVSISAGHGPLMIYRRGGGEVESFGADALPLGVHDGDDGVEPVAHRLAEGDAFVLVTDGFFEWANASREQFGMERLRRSLARHGDQDGDRLIQSLLNDVETFVGSAPQPDDLTAVVIRRRSSGQESGP